MLGGGLLNNYNQRTSGPVNAHLTPGPGIYLNAFINVYSPRAGADNPLGPNVDVNRRPLSLCPFVASCFKTNSLKSDFRHVFAHVYSPRQGQTTHWGLFSLPICCKCQNDLFEICFYTHF